MKNAKGSTIANFIKKFVKTDDAELYTDQYKGYNEVGKEMKNHDTLNRSEEWEAGEMHTNTIEGFWSFVKRAWYGQHHHYSTGYTPLYLAEACYKYNYRTDGMFQMKTLSKFLRKIFGLKPKIDEKEMARKLYEMNLISRSTLENILKQP